MEIIPSAVNPEPLMPLLRSAVEVLGLVSLLDWLGENPVYGVAGLIVVAAGVVAASKKAS